MRACPLCAEEIQDAAIKCKWCGSRVERLPLFVAREVTDDAVALTAAPTPIAPTTPPDKEDEPTSGVDRWILYGGAGLMGVILLMALLGRPTQETYPGSPRNDLAASSPGPTAAPAALGLAAAGASGKALPAGLPKVGQTFSEALLLIGGAISIRMQRENPNQFTDTRRVDGHDYRLTFRRAASPDLAPYRLVSIVEDAPTTSRTDPTMEAVGSPSTGLDVDAYLSARATDARQLAADAAALVQADQMGAARALYVAHLGALARFRREVQADAGLTRTDRARLDTLLRDEEAGARAILAKFDE